MYSTIYTPFTYNQRNYYFFLIAVLHFMFLGYSLPNYFNLFVINISTEYLCYYFTIILLQNIDISFWSGTFYLYFWELKQLANVFLPWYFEFMFTIFQQYFQTNQKIVIYFFICGMFVLLFEISLTNKKFPIIIHTLCIIRIQK